MWIYFSYSGPTHTCKHILKIKHTLYKDTTQKGGKKRFKNIPMGRLFSYPAKQQLIKVHCACPLQSLDMLTSMSTDSIGTVLCCAPHAVAVFWLCRMPFKKSCCFPQICCWLLSFTGGGSWWGGAGRSALASAQTLRFCNYSVFHIRRQTMRCLCHMWCTGGKEE